MLHDRGELRTDFGPHIGDVQGGTTQEGIHLGVMSGTLDLIQRGYIGSDIRDGVLHFSPRLTERLNGLSFPMQFRARRSGSRSPTAG
jgi:trehalose/maltose hydrolase-like predicted phosphorylase